MLKSSKSTASRNKANRRPRDLRKSGQDVNRRNFLRLETLETRWAMAAVAMNDVFHTGIDEPLNASSPGVLANDDSSVGMPWTAALFSGNAYGDLTFNADGSFSYIPDAGFEGMDSFVYTANDGQASSLLAAVTINVSVGTVPVSTNDVYESSEDESLIIPAVAGVLANDDAASSATVALISGPASGELTLSADGGFVYTPEENFSGDVSFTYQATNSVGVGNVATVTLSINAVNDVPVATNDAFTMDEDQALTSATSVLINDSDVEGSALTPTLASQPLHGTVTFNADGTFNYQPNADFNGLDGFSYLVNDGTDNSEVATVTITVNPMNDDPVAVNDEYTIDEDTELNVAATGVLGNDSDIDSSSLTVAMVTGPQHGTVTLNPDGSFVYTPAANYNGVDGFSYQISDGETTSDVASVTINVNPIDDMPIATNDELTTAEDTELIVAAPGVMGNDSDPDGGTLTAQIVSQPVHGTVTLNSDGSLAYMPEANFTGIDGFSYTVSDGTQTSGVATVSINVTPVNDAPSSGADAYTTAEDTPLTVITGGVLDNDSDVEGTALTASLVTGPANGTLTLNPDGTFEYIPSANFSGDDSFVYTATDGEVAGAETTVTITVTPVNDAPTSAADAYTTAEDTLLSVTTGGVLDNDSDIEGTALTAALVTGPANGTLTLNPDGTFEYLPNADFNGDDSFVYTATDGEMIGLETTVTITVTPGNDAPVSAADAYTLDEDNPLLVTSGGVLDNDSDPEGTALTAALVTGPANGTLTLNPDGTFEYVPNVDFHGEDTFVYIASDGELAGAETTVTITVAPINDKPIAEDDAFGTDENTPLTVAAAGVLTNDSDIDGDELTASLIDNPANGTVTMNADGSFVYTPNAGFAGTDTFTYAAGDASEQATATVTITVNDVVQPPVSGEDAYNTAEDIPLSINAAWGVLGNDVDPQGLPLTAEIVTPPAHGQLVLDASGSFQYTPEANWNGVDGFTYRAVNSSGETMEGTAMITVEAINDAPNAVDDSFSVSAGAELTTAAIDGVMANDTDIDSSSLTARMIKGPTHGTIVFNTDGSFTYTPATGYIGSDEFTYQLNDGMTNSIVAHASISVQGEIVTENAPPVGAADSYSTPQDQPLSIAAPGVLSNDTDADGDPLTAQLVTNATSGSVTMNADGSFVYTPNAGYVGSDSFTYAPFDGELAGEPVTVSLTVEGASENQRPIAHNDHYVVQRDAPFTVDPNGLLANDHDPENAALTAHFFGGPQHGTVVVNEDGGFTYTPEPGYVGVDSFLYRVWDGELYSPLAAVTLRVEPGMSGIVAPDEGSDVEHSHDDDYQDSIDCIFAEGTFRVWS